MQTIQTSVQQTASALVDDRSSHDHATESLPQTRPRWTAEELSAMSAHYNQLVKGGAEDVEAVKSNLANHLAETCGTARSKYAVQHRLGGLSHRKLVKQRKATDRLRGKITMKRQTAQQLRGKLRKNREETKQLRRKTDAQIKRRDTTIREQCRMIDECRRIIEEGRGTIEGQRKTIQELKGELESAEGLEAQLTTLRAALAPAAALL